MELDIVKIYINKYNQCQEIKNLNLQIIVGYHLKKKMISVIQITARMVPKSHA